MKRIFVLLFVLCSYSGFLFSQDEKPAFDSLGAIIMPKWMNDILSNSDGVNYKETVDRYNEFVKMLPNNGKKTPYNKTFINAFRWWKRTYSPFVGSDGLIHFPSNSDMNSLVASANRQTQYSNRLKSAVATNDSWHVISPFVTFDADSKKKALWQSNVSRIDASNTNPDIVYCGTDTGMVFKTTDKGKNWTACDPLRFFGGEITTLEVSNSNPDKVVIGSAMNGLFITQDGGNTWKSITPLKGVGKELHRVRDAVFDPRNDNHIIVGTDEGVWDSKDNGVTWTKKLSGMCFDIKYQITSSGQPKIYILKDDDVFASSNGNVRLHISNDNGTSYKVKNLPINDVSCGRLAVSISNPNYLYMIVCQNNYPDKFYFRGRPYILKSTDEGNTVIAHDIHDQVDGMDKPGGQGYYDMVIDVSPRNPEHILFGILFLYSSKDGGRTLDLYPQRYPSNTGAMKPNIGGYYGTYDLHTDMQDLDVASDGSTWLTTDGGIVYSGDFMASEPEVRHNGVYASELWGFDQGWNQDIIVGGRNHNGDMCQDLDNYEGNTMSLKGSENPTGYIFLSNERKITFQDNRKKVIMPDKWDGEYKDFDPEHRFNTWPYESSKFGSNLEFDPRYAKSFLMVSAPGFNDDRFNQKQRSELWKTTDDGLSYELIHNFGKDITSYAISRSNPDKIVVSTIGEIWYTEDGGQNWDKFTLPQEMRECPTYRIAIHPKYDNEIWVGTYDNYRDPGIFVSKDNGKTWTNKNEGLLDMPRYNGEKSRFFVTHFFLTGNEKDAAYAIVENKYQYDYKYHRFENKIVYRDNDTNKWVDISQGLRTAVRINRMKPFYRDSKLRIATDNGVWQRTLVDEAFAPIAQPVILNIGKADEKPSDNIMKFDSYSIVNQKDVKWHWRFNPLPLEIDSYDIRNPKVKIDPEQTYDVWFTVTKTVNGKEVSDTKHIKSMIKGSKPAPSPEVPEPTSIDVIDGNKKSVEIFPTLLSSSTPINIVAKNIGDSMTMYIYDTNGIIVKTLNVKNGDSVPVNNLQKGVHIYKITAKGYEKVGRFLIQ